MPNAKKIRDPNSDSENIQSKYRNGIWDRKMHHTSNEKRETTHDERNQTTKSRKKSELSEKRKSTNTWEYWELTPVEMKDKIKKNTSRQPENYSKQNYIAGTLSKD